MPAGGGWHDCCVLWGVMWRGRSVCDCVWDVETGDRHADVWVLLDGACGSLQRGAVCAAAVASTFVGGTDTLLQS